MALALPAPKPLERGEDFQKWIKSVEIYMCAMNITKEVQKKNIVLHLLGPHMQDIYYNMSNDEEEDTYQQMKDKLKKYYKPTTNPVVERHIFNTMHYESTETSSVEEYVAKLRSQARKCDFPDAEIDSRIRDKLVSTCPYPNVKTKMLREENIDLNLAIKLWSTDMHVRKEAARLVDSTREPPKGEVNKVNFRKKTFVKEKPKTTNWTKRQCYRCGLTNHLVKDCRVPATISCHLCKRTGHLKAACKANEKKRNQRKVHNVNESSQDESTASDDDEDALCVYNIPKHTIAIK